MLSGSIEPDSILARGKPLRERAWRLFDGCAMAHLHSPVKGANRATLEGAAWPPVAWTESSGFACHCRMAPFGGGSARADRGFGLKRGIATVATMTSAEPTRRDFL